MFSRMPGRRHLPYWSLWDMPAYLVSSLPWDCSLMRSMGPRSVIASSKPERALSMGWRSLDSLEVGLAKHSISLINHLLRLSFIRRRWPLGPMLPLSSCAQYTHGQVLSPCSLPFSDL